MQVLTPTGYVDINDLNIGDEVLAYDINDGHLFTNVLEGKTEWTPTMFPPEPPVYEVDEEGNIVYDQDGNPIILEPGKTSEQVFQSIYGDWKFYKINNTWTLFCNQSIWANMNVTHASQLQIGDVIYNDQDQDVVITSIEEVEAPNWWRLDISGDHSFIADGLTLHNASRYWVGGGSTEDWSAVTNTNWGSTSGGANNASIPTTADDVIFDGAGVNGNTNSRINASITILSLNITAGYTATMTHNSVLVINGNWTFRSTYTIAGTEYIGIAATSTITSNGATWPNALNFFNSNTKTLVGDLTVNGLLTAQNSTTTINRTTNENLILNGGFFGQGVTNGTAPMYLKGGSLSTASATLSNPIFIDGNVTISGNVPFNGPTFTYISGTVTTTGSTVNFTSNVTITSGSIVWNNLSLTIFNTTKTLVGNVNVNGVLNLNDVTINRTTTEIINANGGIDVTAPSAGTADIYLKGGTWSALATNRSIGNNLFIEGNVTIGTIASYRTGTLTYISGTVTTTGSTLYINGNCTLNTNGITWGAVYVLSGSTVTLTSNLSTSSLYINQTGTFNKTTSETLTISNGLSVIGGFLFGTADVYLTGGTWSGPSQTRNNVFIQGNVTFASSVFYQTGTLTYVSGTVTTTGSTLTLSASCTLNTLGITWNNITLTNNLTVVTLTSNLTCGGVLTNNGTNSINTSNSSTATLAGGLTMNSTLGGTAKLILTGGTWSGNNGVSNNIDIAGNVTVSGTVLKTGGTLTYVSGTVTVTGSTINFQNACTISTGGMVWNNLGNNSSTTLTLTSNLFIGGSLTTSGGTVPTIAFNRTSTEFISVSGGMSIGGALFGTAPIYFTGGTWTATTFLDNNLFIQGNVTISGNVYYRAGTLKYVSGTVTTTGSTLNTLSTLTIDTFGMVWANLNNSFSSCTITLLSNFVMTGLLTTGNANAGLIINTSVGATFRVGGGITVTRGLDGTAKVILAGGTWSSDGNAISNNLDIDGNATISGSVTYTTNTLTYVSGSVTTTGSTLNITSNCTLNTNGIAWNNITSVNGPSRTITLTSNLLLNGLLSISNGQAFTTTINRTTTETVTLNGGIYLLSAAVSGTAELLLNGGTWYTNLSNAAFIYSRLTINGNITISGDVYFSGNTLTYVSGTVTTTGSRLLLAGNCTLNTNGITWITVVFFATNVTLTSNFTMTGLLTVANNGQCTVNRTSTETFTIGGGINLLQNLQGSANIILTGGTWTSSGSGNFSSNLFFDGNVTISGDVSYSGASLTYLSGNVNALSSQVTFFSTTTISSGNIIWGSVIFRNSFTKTIVGDLIVNGVFLLFNFVASLFRTTSEIVICRNGFLLQNAAISGNADIYVKGGVINCQAINNYIYSNLYIDGNVTLSGIISKSGGILQYISGKVINNRAVLHFNVDVTVLGFDKVPVDAVVCVGFVNIVMDNFFVGTPQRACRITSNTSDSVIYFQDGFEKIARFVNISNTRISRPMQLLVVNNNRFNSNSANTIPNSGIRYINQSPNGAPKNNPSIEDTMTVPALGLVNDPCFQYP